MNNADYPGTKHFSVSLPAPKIPSNETSPRITNCSCPGFHGNGSHRNSSAGDRPGITNNGPGNSSKLRLTFKRLRLQKLNLDKQMPGISLNKTMIIKERVMPRESSASHLSCAWPALGDYIP